MTAVVVSEIGWLCEIPEVRIPLKNQICPQGQLGVFIWKWYSAVTDGSKSDPGRQIWTRVFGGRHNPRPTTIDSGRVFSAAWLLRLCSNLPHLTVVTRAISEELRWTNAEKTKSRMNFVTGGLKTGSPLARHYNQIMLHYPRLRVIEKMLSMEIHRDAPAVIISSFVEIILVIERISWSLILALMPIKVAVFMIDLSNSYVSVGSTNTTLCCIVPSKSFYTQTHNRDVLWQYKQTWQGQGCLHVEEESYHWPYIIRSWVSIKRTKYTRVWALVSGTGNSCF